VNESLADVASELRALAREVAVELQSRLDGSSAPSGWVLWSGLTLTGEMIMKPPYTGFGWWQYTTKLALRTDGELVAFEENVKIEDFACNSPNHGPARGVHKASDAELVYPDVVRWDEHRSVEEAEARTMTDTYRSAAEYGDPLGRGLRDALQELRQAPRSPTLLEPVPSAARPSSPPARKGFLSRLFK
jgi:hypothetical protein